MSLLLTFGLANAVCAALLALAALLVGRFCRRPAVLHSLWLLVLLKLVTPPFWPITVANLPEEPAVPVEAKATPFSDFAVSTTRAPTSEISFVDDSDGRALMKPVIVKKPVMLLPNTAVRTDGKQADTPLNLEFAYSPQEPAPLAPSPVVSTHRDSPEGLSSCVPLLSLAWFAGVVVWLAWAARHIVRFHLLLRHARRANPEVQQQSDALAAQMGLSRGPEIWLLPGSLPPLVWGAIGRVRIFFPAKLLDRLDDTERGSLLAHELAHVLRRDHWVRWLELLATALYWWYPLVWLARRRLHVHEEECCDAWVIGEVPARVYAGAILNTLDFLAEDRAPLPVMASGLAGVEMLKRRLSLIMEGGTPKRLSRSGRWALLLAGLTLLSLRPNLAHTETKSAIDNESEKKPASAAAVHDEKGEDAESFLPNPIPLRGNALSVGGVAFSPDGKILAMGAGWGDQPVGELRLWDVDKGQMSATLRVGRPVRSVAFSPDGKHLASAEFDGTVKLRDPKSGTVRATLRGHTVGVNFVAFSADSKTLAAAGLDHDITLWDVAERKQRLRLRGHTDMVLSVAFSPDGKTLASASKDRSAILWDVVAGKKRVTLSGHNNVVECIVFAPNGKTVATGSWDGQVKVWDAADGKGLQSLQGPGGIIYCLAYSPDGKTLVASGPGASGNVRLWDTATGNVRGNFATNVPTIFSAAFSPDGKCLAVGSREGLVKIWDVAGRKELAVVRNSKARFFEPQPVIALAASPDGKSVAIAGEDGGVQLCEVASGIQRHVLKGHDDVVTCLAYSPDGKLLATGSPDQKIKLWDPATGKEVRTLEGHTSWVYALAFAPDGKTLASGSYDKTIHLWDPVMGKSLRILEGHKASVRALAFSPDGQTLASGSSDRTIRLWPMDRDDRRDAGPTGEPVILKGHEDAIRVVAFSPDGKTLASGSDDQTIKLWNAAKKEERATLKGHRAEVTTLSFSPHGKTLVSGGRDNVILVWDPGTGSLRSRLGGHNEAITGVLVTSDGQRLLSASFDRTVKLWLPLAPAEQARLTFRGHAERVWCVAFAPDGRTLATGGGGDNDGELKLWDSATGKERAAVQTAKAVRCLAYSPNGQTLATGCFDNNVQLREPATGKVLRILMGHKGGINSLAFSPDGRWLATGSLDSTAKLWELATGKDLRTFKGHQDWVLSVAFAPDGKTLATASKDKTVRLWDAATGKLRRQLRGHDNNIEAVAFTPDGKTLATGSWDESILLWDTATGRIKGRPEARNGGFNTLAFAPDGKTLATGGMHWPNADSGELRLWDIATGRTVRVFSGHTRAVRSVCFTPDGKTLASASDDGIVKVWTLTSPRRSGTGQ